MKEKGRGFLEGELRARAALLQVLDHAGVEESVSGFLVDEEGAVPVEDHDADATQARQNGQNPEGSAEVAIRGHAGDALSGDDGSNGGKLPEEGVESLGLVDRDYIVGKLPEEEADGDGGVNLRHDIIEGEGPVVVQAQEVRETLEGGGGSGGVELVAAGVDDQIEQ